MEVNKYVVGMIYHMVIVEVNKQVVSCVYRPKNCKNHFKIVGQIVFKKEKEKKRMTWQLMWRNVRVAVLNAMLQLLVIQEGQ